MKEKSGEVIRYIIIGVTTTLVNLLIYHVLLYAGLDYRIANIIAIISAKLYAYVTNKKFVFRSKCANWKDLVAEACRYILARGFTGVLDYFGLIFAVEVLHADKVISKYVLQVIVIVLNYVFGKFVVFKGKRDRNP